MDPARWPGWMTGKLVQTYKYHNIIMMLDINLDKETIKSILLFIWRALLGILTNLHKL